MTADAGKLGSLVAAVGEKKDDLQGSLAALSDVVAALEAALKAEKFALAPPAGSEVGVSLEELEEHPAVVLIDGAAEALQHMRDMVMVQITRSRSSLSPSHQASRATPSQVMTPTTPLPRRGSMCSGSTCSEVPSLNATGPMAKPLTLLKGLFAPLKREKPATPQARRGPLPIQTSSTTQPSSPRTTTWRHFVEDSCFMFPQGCSFARATTDADLQSVDGILDLLRKTEAETGYGLGKVMKDFKANISTHGRGFALGSECGKFEKALAEHLFLLWRYSLESEEDRAALRTGIAGIVKKQLHRTMLVVFQEQFAAEDKEVTAAVEKVCALREKAGAMRARDNALTTTGVSSLREVAEGCDPEEKLDSILRCLTVINAHIKARAPTDDAAGGADDMMPLFLKCLLLANPAHAKSTSEFVETFAPPSVMNGEAGYASATFSAAIAHVAKSTPDNLLQHVTS
eukprot:TRINITY_DN3258_c0_g1_i1.p1 TRINITY_DN3258_c0_g1~~TRINITY_DN3258_c0_g1_i1.p1  ORF type:complete len:486 (+),score=173.88 TRINITY_DN3258_c0_g1_i1:86-1459(+)